MGQAKGPTVAEVLIWDAHKFVMYGILLNAGHILTHNTMAFNKS